MTIIGLKMSNSRFVVSVYCLRPAFRLLLWLCAALLLTALVSWRDVIARPSLWSVLPPLSERHLAHLRRSRRLIDYIDEEDYPLISPQSGYCASQEDLDVVALVSSAAGDAEQRAAVRATWGREFPTYFFIGRTSDKQLGADEDMVSFYIEGRQHGDIVVGDYIDSYENLTLKTAHMLQWTGRNCPHARFVLKTDDDVLVNPWTLREVLRENQASHLVGYKVEGSAPHRDGENKWYLPKWLYRSDVIPEYLSGTAYLINGDHLFALMEAAKQVPLINLEDVYLTYLVAREHLGLTLTHDRRLSPFQPIVSSACSVHKMATAHSLTARQMRSLWPKIQSVEQRYESGQDPCYLFDKMFAFLAKDEFLV